MVENEFIFISGILNPKSVIHEFLHQVVHTSIMKFKDTILQYHVQDPDIDESHYLYDNEDGKVNAFEEYMIRRLASSIIAGNTPSDLSSFIDEILRN